MTIAIYGLGYVGVVMGAMLADEGHMVIGIDVQASKVEAINAGQSPIVEDGVPERIAAHCPAGTGRFRASTDRKDATDATMSVICVGTPSEPNGNINLAYVSQVFDQLADQVTDGHTIVLRSTAIPGTTREMAKKVPQANVVFNPEFLREGSAVYDFNNPPKTVIGVADGVDASACVALYEDFGFEVTTTALEAAEMVKYADNTFHALKVGFANEIGAICDQFGVDSHAVMGIFKSDTKLNISDKYLLPGLPFGGSCLPKDLRAITYLSKEKGLNLPILHNVLSANTQCMGRYKAFIDQLDKQPIILSGLSFKAGTDDLRESPLVELAEYLLGKGFPLKIYDPNIEHARLVGANKAFIDQRIPHLAALLESDEAVLDEFATLVLSSQPQWHDKWVSKTIIDLTRPLKQPTCA